MKALVCVLGVLLAVSAVPAEKPSSVTWEGRKIEEIIDVHVNPDGKIIVIHAGGGFSTTEEKLPPGFLQAWGLTEENLATARSARTQSAQDSLDRAVRAGQFREVGGIVYDLRKTQPDWVQFPKLKVIQVVEEGVLMDCSPDQSRPTVIFVRHLPKTLSDTDIISLTVKLTGSFSYLNKLGVDRTIRAYDVGRPCSREEIPDAITKENKLWAKLVVRSTTSKNLLPQVPDGAEIISNGTGFFITADGYLLTDWHVVNNARKVKIKTRQGILPAQIVTTDRTRDLALLKVGEGRFNPLPLSSANSVSLGESAFTIGFPNVLVQGLEPKYTDGKISSLSGLRDDPSQYQISVPVQPGNSGGPLMGRNGQVIGIINAKLNELSFLVTSGSLPQNVNYATKASVIREFLQKIPQLKLPASTSLKPEEAVKGTEEAVAMVLVY